MNEGGEPLLRHTALVCVVMAAAAWMWRPEYPRLALGVLGGGVLVGIALWAISGAVAGLVVVDPLAPPMRDLAGVCPASGEPTQADKNPKNARVLPRFHLVKFFTRHVILALTGYGMMVRLHLDPVGMLVGVTSVVIAAALSIRDR